MDIIRDLLDAGATVAATDPEAIPNFSQYFNGNVDYNEDMYDVLDGADALAIVTEWNEFRTPDFNKMAVLLKEKVIFDGRNLYDNAQMRLTGFYYESIGRPLAKS
jgi:UDPglucose 6-dehydrogenase